MVGTDSLKMKKYLRGRRILFALQEDCVSACQYLLQFSERLMPDILVEMRQTLSPAKRSSWEVGGCALFLLLFPILA